MSAKAEPCRWIDGEPGCSFCALSNPDAAELRAAIEAETSLPLDARVELSVGRGITYVRCGARVINDAQSRSKEKAKQAAADRSALGKVCAIFRRKLASLQVKGANFGRQRDDLEAALRAIEREIVDSRGCDSLHEALEGVDPYVYRETDDVQLLRKYAAQYLVRECTNIWIGVTEDDEPLIGSPYAA